MTEFVMNNLGLLYSLSVLVVFLFAIHMEDAPIGRWTSTTWGVVAFVSIVSPMGLVAIVFELWTHLIKEREWFWTKKIWSKKNKK